MPNDEKLLEKMRASKHGWGADDLHSLLIRFNFLLRQGGKHIFYYHRDFPDIHMTVARHRSLPVGYIQKAIKLIDELKRRQGTHAENR